MKAIMEKKAVNKTVICLMVENQPNVLARISSLVGRRSFNISTITASETNVSGITKITLVVNGDDENVLYQIIAQMKKLENVNEAYVLPDTAFTESCFWSRLKQHRRNALPCMK